MSFFERRNRIAHSLNATHSSAPDQILKDIDMFDSIGLSLCETLESESGEYFGSSIIFRKSDNEVDSESRPFNERGLSLFGRSR